MPRNSSGTYTLPAGNPVAANTIIETAWANPTMSDIGAALTDSLDRFGRGSMLAPIKAPDGAFNAPVYSFSSEATMGIYRVSSNVLGIAMAGLTALSIGPTAATFNAAVHPVWAADPVSGDDLVRKSYLAAQVGLYLPLTGGTLAGPGNLAVGGALTVASTLGVTGVTTLTTLLANNVSVAATIAAGLGAVGTPSYTFLGDLNTGMWSPGADTLGWSTAGVQRLNISSAGVADFLGNTLLGVGNIGGNADSGAWSLWGGRTTGNGGGLALYGSTNATPNLIVFTRSGTEIARFDAVGKLGIGGASAGGDVEIIRAAGDPYLRITNGTVQTYLQASNTGSQAILGTLSNHPIGFFVNSTERARFDTLGNFNIGRISNSFSSTRFWVNQATNKNIAAYYNGADPSLAAFDDVGAFIRLGLIGSGIGFSGDSGATTSFQISTANIGSVWNGTALQEIGFRSLIVSTPAGTSNFVVAQRGAMVVGNLVNLTLNTGIFARGDVLTIYQDSASTMTITQGAGFTLRLNGTATTGNRTGLGRGVVTILFNSGSEAIATGAVT